jgi:RHS repeat-associated protein
LTGRYLHGDAVDQIFAEEVGGQTRWTLTDHLGSVRDVLSDTGVTLGRITYDSFGQVTNTTGIVDTLFRYTGRPGLASTGLYDYRARVYDPPIGQFLSEDPIGFAGGDWNTRRYVKNEPTRYTDPSGLKQVPRNRGDDEVTIRNITIVPNNTQKYTLYLAFYAIPLVNAKRDFDKNATCLASMLLPTHLQHAVVVAINEDDPHQVRTFSFGLDGKWYENDDRDLWAAKHLLLRPKGRPSLTGVPLDKLLKAYDYMKWYASVNGKKVYTFAMWVHPDHYVCREAAIDLINTAAKDVVPEVPQVRVVIRIEDLPVYPPVLVNPFIPMFPLINWPSIR